MFRTKVTKLLKESGYKLTRQRHAIIEVLLNNEGPLTVQELFHQVKNKLPTISYDTLYRNLEILSSIKAMSRIHVRGGDRFELEQHHHHHFTCLGCGEVTCLKGCPIGPEQLAEAKNHGFNIIHHNFELSGYCAKCRSFQKDA